MEADFCLSALNWALSKGKPEIFNSDQGAQFTGHTFSQQLEQRGILDVELEDGTDDAQYLDALRAALDTVFNGSRTYDLVHYQAGAGPFVGDALGNLQLSFEGLMARDRAVFGAAIEAHAPVIVTLVGGYAPETEDVVQIHCNTVKAALDAARTGSRPGSG
jgi:acetoin utilization deacetylase AcuC-like enzyme